MIHEFQESKFLIIRYCWEIEERARKGWEITDSLLQKIDENEEEMGHRYIMYAALSLLIRFMIKRKITKLWIVIWKVKKLRVI